MSKTKIAENVKIGHIYECNFGLYKKIDGSGETSNAIEASDGDLNYRIPHELIKKRPVIVIGKHRGLCTVVPISTTFEDHKKEKKIPENMGIHVRIPEKDFPKNSRNYQSNIEMWAKCNLVCHVDNGRLRDLVELRADGVFSHIPAFKISDELLLAIRKGVILSIGMKPLLDKVEILESDLESIQKS